ncbi:MAG: mdtE [Gemmataceae bacterium]|nr:mdtE [Gemmataceae bacterium]
MLLAFVPACNPKPADAGGRETGPAPVPVTVVPVSPVTLQRTVPVVGTLDPYKDVLLAPKVDGRVVRVLRDTGDVVRPGDVLLELDPTEYALDVEVARAGLEAELARLSLTGLPAGEIDLNGVKSVARARASLNLAAKEFARATDERTRGVGTPQTYDKAEAEVELAETGLRVAEADARATLATARRMKATLDKAADRLRDAVLRAPVPDEWGAWAAAVGPAACPLRYVVAQRLVWEGEVVRGTPEKNVYRLVLAHVLKLRAAVPEKHAPGVKVGQPVVVRADAFPDRVFRGVVARVGPTVDTLNRTFQVEVEVPNGDPRAVLKPGTFGKAEIETRADAGVVVAFAGVNKVFVVDGDRAKAIEVQLGQRDKDWVEVIGPVPPGAQIVTSGFSQLVDGSPIRLR